MRILLYIFLFYLAVQPFDFTEAGSETENPVILVLGDSLSAGFGIDQSSNWVSLLQNKLKNKGFSHVVFNASISGETTLGGLNRLPELLKQRPGIVIIELGANDGLRGLPIFQIKANIEKMIALSTSSGAEVLLLGIKLPPNYGPAYTNSFHDIYRILSTNHDIKLVPFFLDGITNQRHLMQEDNLHPATEAQPLILENIWPELKILILKTKNNRAKS